MVRVLIADDSPLTRAVLRDLLEQDPQISVIGEVSDGRQAVAATCELRPDLVILDVMMPVMDGLEAVSEIMADCPTPILVLSARVDRSASRNAFETIERGALDVMEKPKGVGSAAFEGIAAALCARVKSLARVRVIHHYRREKRVAAPAPQTAAPPGSADRSLLTIGASTGGPKAILQLLQGLPQRPVPVLIVQHIASGFAEGFADWLDRACSWTVRVAQDGEALTPGVVLIAPCGRHMEVDNGRIRLSGAPPVNSCRPAADVLFRSLAGNDRPGRIAAVLLTGMGSDGAAGLLELKTAGAVCLVQDEESCAVFGMPRSAIERGAADLVLALDEIPLMLKQLLVD